MHTVYFVASIDLLIEPLFIMFKITSQDVGDNCSLHVYTLAEYITQISFWTHPPCFDVSAQKHQ